MANFHQPRFNLCLKARGIIYPLTLTIIYAAYTTIKRLLTLEKSQARRVLDLMVIGAIFFLLDFLMLKECGGQTIILRTAGVLIFLYGYGILLLEKYRQGGREGKS